VDLADRGRRGRTLLRGCSGADRPERALGLLTEYRDQSVSQGSRHPRGRSYVHRPIPHAQGLRRPGGVGAIRLRDDLRRVLIHDQADRDAVAAQLLRYRDGHGDDWADIIDMLTMHPEERRRVVRLLGELDLRRTRLFHEADCPTSST
jgi:hypothetical protein